MSQGDNSVLEPAVAGVSKADLEQLLSAASTLAPASPRIGASAIRPLRALLDGAAGRTRKATHREQAPARAKAPSREDIERLARRATALRSRPGAPTALIEATAALQALALERAETESPEARATLSASLAQLQAELRPAIQPAPNGPLLVTNVEQLRTWLGEPISTAPQMALCRCGASGIKPFCDGSHATSGFSDAKDPQRVPDQRDTYVGQQVTILDNRGTCQHAGYCSDRLREVFRVGKEPFVAPTGGRMDEIIRAVRDCPSGALSYALGGVEARDHVDHNASREPAIEVSKDGPYRITGGIAIVDESGEELSRNEGASHEHYALCRCGHAQNKPFCTGMHWYVEFKDPVPAPDRVPTVFEWAGGLPALTRMARLFYEKFIPNDPLLAPVFANMAGDHPERVARWLSEVFGGPRFYSEAHGGYERMLSQHIGKGITEEWRARWVTLLIRAADDAGLPNDPEFRSVFQSYIEWGSRLAVENSQPQSKPPPRMPMPSWGWMTAAGPPGSRVSALATEPEEEPEVELPAEDEPVSFASHIRPLFRDRDRRSMLFAFDLWSHDDVAAHGEAIAERLGNGTMPCDGAWPAEWVGVFKRWLANGKRP